MAKVDTNVTALNLIRESASENYKNLVPVATKDNLQAVGNPILQYSSVRNEFLELLVNKIARPIEEARRYRNPLSLFKRQGSPLTSDEEEIGVNPAEAESFNATSTDLLAQHIPDVKVAYHRMNRQEKYPQTVQFAVMRSGFTSWGGFDNMVDMIVESLYNGNYIDEFKYTKQIIASTAITGAMAYKVLSLPEDEATAKAFVKSAKSVFSGFTFASTKYNNWNRLGGSGNAYQSWSKPDEICLIMRSDISAEVDVEVLARAFNIDYAKFLGKVLMVDDFGEGAEDIFAIMCDKKFPVIIDKLNIIEDFRNGSNLSTNYWLHVWQTYSTSPLKNACCFRTAEPVTPEPTPDPDPTPDPTPDPNPET